MKFSFSYFALPLAVLFAIGGIFLAARFGGGQVLTGLAGIDTPSETPDAVSDLIGKKAPYFDLANTHGDHVNFTQVVGTPLVLVFWATWESRAADQIPIIESYVAQLPEKDVVRIIPISSQEDRSIVTSFIRRGGYVSDSLIDEQGSVSADYGIRGLPTVVCIDRDGIVRDVHTGLLSAQALGEKVETIMQ